MKRWLGILLLALAVTLSALWACAAIWTDGPDSRGLAGLIAGAFILVPLFAFFRSRHLPGSASLYALPFDELRRRSHINERAIAAKDSPDFWKQIRVGLPVRPRTDR